MEWKKTELEAYAEDAEIDLAGATTKAQILAVIYTAGGTEPVVGWGLEVIVAYAALHTVTLTDPEDLAGSTGEVHTAWELSN